MNDLTKFEAQAPTVEAGVSAAESREQHLIQAAIITAKKFPRDEEKAIEKMRKAFKRRSLAEGALYRYPRGNTNISGPSIKLAREVARLWGNLQTGSMIVSMDSQMVHIKGFALDVETNTLIQSEAKFKQLIFRKGRGWIVPDERELRELINKHAAIAIRNSILQIIPSDVIEELVLIAEKVLKSGSSKDLKKDRETTVQSLVNSFGQIAVEKHHLEKWLEHTLDEINDEQLAELRGIWKSIFDGVSKREAYFDIRDGADPSEEADRANDLFNQTKNKK